MMTGAKRLNRLKQLWLGDIVYRSEIDYSALDALAELAGDEPALLQVLETPRGIALFERYEREPRFTGGCPECGR
jgi:hypothetical protein